MGSVRYKKSWNDFVFEAVGKPVCANVTVITITNKQTLSSICFFPSKRLKALPQLIRTMLIACPILGIIADMPVFGSISWYLIMVEIFSFEDDARRKQGTVCVNTFDYCNPFLSTQLYLMICWGLSNTYVNNNLRCLNSFDCKSTFVYIGMFSIWISYSSITD